MELGNDVIIDNDKAGIGDIVVELTSNTGTPNYTNTKVIKGSTYTSGISGYRILGIIYGFEDGEAMLIANTTDLLLRYATTSGLSEGDAYNAPWFEPFVKDADCPNSFGLLRNGKPGTYALMNLKRVKQLTNQGNSASSTLVHPLSSYYNSASAPMSETTFYGNSTNAKEARRLYHNSYDAYLMQTAPMEQSPKSVFNREYHCGKEYTAAMAAQGASVFPAATYCYNYDVVSPTRNMWWLPDMVELLQLMKDSTLDLVNLTYKKLGKEVINPAHSNWKNGNRWSSVRYSAGYAWRFTSSGIPDYARPVSSSLPVRAVTRVRLTKQYTNFNYT